MIRVACQTYTWEMLGAEWKGTVDWILDAVAAAGYAGIEITNMMIREYADKAGAFRAALGRRGLALAAFAYAATGFTDPAAHASDLEGCRRALAFVAEFPEPRIGLGGAAAPAARGASARGPAERRAALDQAIRFYDDAGRLGQKAGVSVNVHPHSHYGSLLESAEEYRYLMDRLDPAALSFGPDTGHIVRGGQDLLTCLKTYRPRITHLHLKDASADGTWQALGRGGCDFRGVLSLLRETAWDGWLVAEEESEAARKDGVAAIRGNREYLRTLGL
jgi:inosose dehydratase